MSTFVPSEYSYSGAAAAANIFTAVGAGISAGGAVASTAISAVAARKMQASQESHEKSMAERQAKASRAKAKASKAKAKASKAKGKAKAAAARPTLYIAMGVAAVAMAITLGMVILKKDERDRS